MLTFYIRGRSSLRIQSLTAGITLIAARFAPVAPQGEIRTLDEHGLLADRFGELARHGPPLYVFGAVLKLGASARTRRRSRASPLRPNGSRSTSLRLHPDYHPLPNSFCQQR